MFSRASASLRSWLCQMTAPGASTATNASAFACRARRRTRRSSRRAGHGVLSLSADVETLGVRRHLVEELATPRRVGSTRHVAEVLQEDEAVDAEVLVAADGVGVDGAGQRRDRDLERAELGGAVDLVGEAGRARRTPSGCCRDPGRSRTSRRTARRRAEGGGREPTAEDRRPPGAVRPGPALDAPERGEVAPELRLVVAPERAQRVDPFVGAVPRVWNGTPMASYSPGTYPTPMPTTRRPRESTSIVASSLARMTGFRNGRITMPVPSRMRSVVAAAYASTGMGSMSSECGGRGDGGSCGSISTGCSPTQIESYPSASAVCAISATLSRRRTRPSRHRTIRSGSSLRHAGALVATRLRAPDVRHRCRRGTRRSRGTSRNR